MEKHKTDISSLFIYMGNKRHMASWIVQKFPPHKMYVEVFGGTYAVGMNKPKSKIEIYNDKNYHLSNLFEVIRTKKDLLIDKLDGFGINEALYKHFYKNHEPIDDSKIELGDVEAAARYMYIMLLCAFGRYDGGFRPKYSSDMHLTFRKKINVVNDIHNRIKETVVVSRDFDRVIKNTDSEDTLFYLDPPYDGTEGYYKTIVGDFGPDKHEALRDQLANIKGKFFLSYEESEFILDLYKDFKVHSMNKTRHGYSSNRESTKAKEILITNHEDGQDLFSQMSPQ